MISTAFTKFFIKAYLLAHSWYPLECCSEKDCQPVACKDLLEQADGSFLYQGMKFTKDMIKPSLDQFCHVCFLEGAKTPLCIFIQLST